MAIRSDEARRESYNRPDVCTRMLKNYKLSNEAEAYNRERAVNAIKFANGEQWTPAQKADRTAYSMPSEVYNQIPQFVHQVTNDLRMNMPQTSFVPADDSDKERAEIREDLVRSIQTATEGEVAYDTAASCAVIAGWGYWRYLTAYENDKTFDQIIKCGWVPNAMSVYDDPNCTDQDKLDRGFLIHVYDMQKADFNSTYNKDYSDQDLRGIGNEAPDWGGTDMVRVAEYWERTVKTKKLYRTKDGKITSKKPAGDAEERDVDTYSVKWYKCTANDLLEEREWKGMYIPYVFVSGEATLVDGKWRYDGIVNAMMGPQIQFNYAVNNAIYMASLAPKNQFIVDPNAIAGFESFWNEANTVPRAYLPYRQYDSATGLQYAPPQRAQNGVDLSAAANLIQIAQQNFYNVTGIYPASLGQSSNEKSGKAIIARQREGDTSTFHYGDNVARALRAGGRILDDLISVVYDGSRTIKGVKEDGTTRDIVINKPFKDKDGSTKEYDMTQSGYGVVVSTGPSYGTKRQEMADAMNQLAPALIGSYPAVGPEWIRAQDWPGSDAIAEAMERSLPPELQKPVEDEGLPPQVVTQMTQMQTVIQQLRQQLQAAAQELQSNQADIQTKQAELQLKAQDQQGKQAYDAAKLELDARKIALDERKQNLEEERLQLEVMSGQMNAMQANSESTETQEEPETMSDDEGVLMAQGGVIQAHLEALQRKRQEEAMNAQMMQEMQMQEQMSRSQQAEIEAQTAAQQAQLAQETIDMIRNQSVAIAGLLVEINKPKTISIARGPDGLASGAVIAPVEVIGNA